MTIADSNPFNAVISDPPISTAPAWVSTAIGNGWSVGEWIICSGNTTLSYGLTNSTPGTFEGVTLQEAQSGPNDLNDSQGLIASWSGGATIRGFRSHGGVAICGGGHGTGRTNELFLYDFNSRLWVELWPDSRVTSPTNGPAGEYADGSVIMNHWTGMICSQGPGNVFFGKGYNSNGGGSDSSSIAKPHRYDTLRFETNGQDAANYSRVNDIPVSQQTVLRHGACAEDYSTEKVWWFSHDTSNQQVRGAWVSWDPATGQWTNHDDGSAGDYWNSGWNSTYTVAAIDSARQIFLITEPGNNRFRAMDINNPTDYRQSGNVSWVVTPSGARSIGQNTMFAWVPSMDSFLTWKMGSNNVYRYAYVSGNAPSNYQLAGSIVGSSGVLVPSTNGAGTTTGISNQAGVAEWGTTVVVFATLDWQGPTYAFLAAV